MNAMANSTLGIIIALVGIVCGYIISKKFMQPAAQPKVQDPPNTQPNPPSKTTSKSKSAHPVKAAHSKFSTACAKPEHPLFLFDFGGHSVDVLAVACSPDGRIICSVSRDGILRCTAISDIGSSSQQHNASIALTGVDTHAPIALTWTANSKRVVVNIGSKVAFFRVDLFGEKKSISEAKTMTTSLLNINKIQLLDVEKWMLLTVSGEDTNNEPVVLLYDHSGSLIGSLTVDGALSRHTDGPSGKNRISKQKERGRLVGRPVLLEASPDNRYLAVSGHIAEASSASAKLGWNDVGIYEVTRSKGGEPIGLTLVLIFGGHQQPVSTIAWNPSGQSAVTVCNESSEKSVWRIWDTSVPKIDLPVEVFATSNAAPEGIDTSHAVLNQPGTVVVFANGCDLYYCSSGNGEVKHVVKGALGNSVVDTSSFFVATMGNKELKWCFATLVRNSKRVALWKFKE